MAAARCRFVRAFIGKQGARRLIYFRKWDNFLWRRYCTRSSYITYYGYVV